MLRTTLVLSLFGGVACTGDSASDSTTADTAPLSPDTTEPLPEGVFLVDLELTTGPVVLEIHEDWAPLGVARFRELVEAGFYDDTRFFRVLPDFVVQFGLSGDPEVSAKWADATIPDDPVERSNRRRTITYATAGPNTRTTQLFINYADNSRLDGMGFAPIAIVLGDGMSVVDAINSEYREQPSQGMIQSRGNDYLRGSFPNLDYVLSATIVE